MSRFAIALGALAALVQPALAQFHAAHHTPAYVQPKPADTVLPGFTVDARRAVGVFDAQTTLSNGDRVIYDGADVFRVAENGAPIATLASIPGFNFASLVIADPSESFVLVGESSNGLIYKVSLSGGGALPLADIDFNFDALFEDATHALITASPCGFFCGSELYRLDVATGATSLVANVPGASGPIARAANGDIYLGRQSDSFLPGTWALVRWSASQITSGNLLTIADATIVVPALDGAADLAIDQVTGHVFLAESEFGSPSHIVEFDTLGTRIADVVTSSNWLSDLQFAFGAGPGSFQAFQPTQGVTLRYRSTNYTRQYSGVLTVRPRRPIASISGPGLSGPGIVVFEDDDAAPNGSFVVLTSPSNLYNPIETTYDLGTFLFHTGMPPGSIHAVAEVPTDSAGHGMWSFVNSGGLQGTLALQSWIKDGAGVRIGSSTTVFN